MPADDAGQRLRPALEMFDFGVRMQRCRLRRTHPDVDDAEVDMLMTEWMLDRPGAQDGDCAGPVSRRS